MSKEELANIQLARTYLDEAPGLSAVLVRSSDKAVELGISGLLWLLSTGTVHRNDVEPLLDQLEEACK